MNATSLQGGPHSGPEAEPDTRRIWCYIASALVFLVVFQIAAYFWFLGMKDAEIRAKEVYSRERAPEGKAADTLETYQWLNQEQGRVRIPVSRAMEILADSARGANQGKR
jgi:hypothetical protein